MKYFIIILLAFATVSCKSDPELEVLSANDIINKSIEVSGGERFNNSSLKFEFRDVYYQALRKNNEFLLVRVLVKDNDSIFDMLSNVGFERYDNEKFVKLEDSMVKKYKASVNSVHYFSVLPYGLNDKAVHKELVSEEQIRNQTYYKIKVSFSPEGGGEDYEDIFIYWINKDNFKADFIAYSYNEDDGVGMRFRVAYNERYVNGLRFVDYNNYKTKDSTLLLTELGKAFHDNNLTLLSKIELENVTVDLVNN